MRRIRERYGVINKGPFRPSTPPRVKQAEAIYERLVERQNRADMRKNGKSISDIENQTRRLVKAAGGKNTERGKQILALGKRYANNAAKAMGYSSASRVWDADIAGMAYNQDNDPNQVGVAKENRAFTRVKRDDYMRSPAENRKLAKQKAKGASFNSAVQTAGKAAKTGRNGKGSNEPPSKRGGGITAKESSARGANQSAKRV